MQNDMKHLGMGANLKATGTFDFAWQAKIISAAPGLGTRRVRSAAQSH